MCRLQLAEFRRFEFAGFLGLLRSWFRLAKCAVFGTDLVFGSKPDPKRASNRIICVGDCTRKYALDNGYVHVPGCPPSRDEIINKL